MRRGVKYAVGIGAGILGAALLLGNRTSAGGSSVSPSSTGGGAPTVPQFTVTVSLASKTRYVGQAMNLSVSVKPSLPSGYKISLVNSSSNKTLYTSLSSTFAAQITPNTPGNLVIEWVVLDGNGNAVQHGAAVTVSIQNCQSQYGCDPSKTPTNVPSGYKAVYQAGYGWEMQETAAQIAANTQKIITSDVTSSPKGASWSGANAQQSATQLAQAYQQKYGGQWGVYQIGSTYYVQQGAGYLTENSQYKGQVYSIGTAPAPAPTPAPAYTKSNNTSCPPGYSLQNGTCVLNASSYYNQAGDGGNMPSGDVSYSPSQALTAFKNGQLPGPGFTVNGVWYPTISAAQAAATATGSSWNINGS